MPSPKRGRKSILEYILEDVVEEMVEIPVIEPFVIEFEEPTIEESEMELPTVKADFGKGTPRNYKQFVTEEIFEVEESSEPPSAVVSPRVE